MSLVFVLTCVLVCLLIPKRRILSFTYFSAVFYSMPGFKSQYGIMYRVCITGLPVAESFDSVVTVITT